MKSEYKTIAVVAVAIVLVAALVLTITAEDDADFELQSSSSAGMLSALDAALANEEHIVVTLWDPHWAFAAYDTDDYHLVYLEDPELVFGEAESIETIANKEWAEDAANADAATILGNFNWTVDEINDVMNRIQEEDDDVAGAQSWVNDNSDTVANWTAGLTGTGDIEIGYVLWDCAIASSNVMKIVLEDAGWSVELTDLEAGPMYTGLATGSIDVITTAWVPATHAAYIEQYGDDLETLGVNLEEGAALGLVVPNYTAEALDLTSIADLQGKGDYFNNVITGIDSGAGIMAMAEEAIKTYELA